MTPKKFGAMPKYVTALALLACTAFLPATTRAQSEAKESEEVRRLRDAVTVFEEVMKTKDAAIPLVILSRAEGIVIIPSMVKAGFIVGGMRGRGVLVAKRGDSWTAPAFVSLTGGSFGLQIGGQAVDLILVIQNRRGLEQFVKNQFKLGTDASVAAGPVGREAQAATDLQMRAEILSYSRARGLFAGVTINGSTVRADLDANERFYGTRLTMRQIVLEGQPTELPPSAGAWREILAQYELPEGFELPQ